jgi:hypothetical protein
MNNGSDYDFIIIGSGAGGGTLAYRLAPSGKKILLIERGPFVRREKDNWNSQAVNAEGKYNTKELWRDQDGKELPVMISAAVGRGGETMISAQTTEAFWNAVRHVKPLSVGLNCSLGPDLMYPFLEELSEKADVAISCYPNAGLPNPLSETGFDLGPQDMARYLGDFARGGLINIAGGCCGNTPEHIAAIAKALEGQPPRKWGTQPTEKVSPLETEIESSA